MTIPCGRFAPSPTGRLHFGSLVAALGSWLHARAAGGRWVIRIEDIDPPREVPGAAEDILATLEACGLRSDDSVLFQSERTPAHDDAIGRLIADGHVYACRCSRSALAAFGGIHPRRCLEMRDPGSAPAWRLRVADETIAFVDGLRGPQRQDLAREVGDFVVRRVEGRAAYHLAVVVDDAAQGVTEVVRGADLLDATPRQILLQRRLGLPAVAYHHLPLALDAAGRKLAKHDAAVPVDRRDPLPALRAALAFLGQPAVAAGSVDALLAAALCAFDPRRIPRNEAPMP
jgi:glutamyl-Q tRNA(Asp) synthetase